MLNSPRRECQEVRGLEWTSFRAEEKIAELPVSEKERIVGVGSPRRGAVDVPIRCRRQVRVFVADVAYPLVKLLCGGREWFHP